VIQGIIGWSTPPKNFSGTLKTIVRRLKSHSSQKHFSMQKIDFAIDQIFIFSKKVFPTEIKTCDVLFSASFINPTIAQGFIKKTCLKFLHI